MLDLSRMGFLKPRNERGRGARVRQIGLFATLTRRERRVLESLLQERRYIRGEIIFDEGEEAQALYLVLEGKVLICRQGEPETGALATIEPGAVFGELALLHDMPRAAQARAAEDCLLASLSRVDFESLLQSHAVVSSKIALQLARQLGNQLRNRQIPVERQPL